MTDRPEPSAEPTEAREDEPGVIAFAGAKEQLDREGRWAYRTAEQYRVDMVRERALRNRAEARVRELERDVAELMRSRIDTQPLWDRIDALAKQVLNSADTTNEQLTALREAAGDVLRAFGNTVGPVGRTRLDDAVERLAKVLEPKAP